MTHPSSSRSRLHARFLFAIAIPAAMIAGAVGLAVQIVCTRLAVQSFGSSSTTISAMIGMALLGLSLGAWTIGRFADRVKSPLQVLGFSFLLCAATVENIAHFSDDFATLIYTRIGTKTDGLIGDVGQHIVFALATLFPINFLLGGVLPLLTKAVFSVGWEDRTVRNRFGLLYAAETFGAAAGALLTGFWSIQFLGLQATLHLSALFVGITGCMVWCAGKIPIHPPVKTKQENTESTAIDKHFRPTSLLFVVAVAGSASLGMELIWQRFLVILFGSDTHSFSIVAATFLVGISTGAVISSILIRKVQYLLWAYGLIVLAIGVSAICITNLLLQAVGENPIGWSRQLFIQQPVVSRFIFSFGLLIVPTMLIGAGFPIAVHLWIQDVSRSGRHTGQIYGMALMGNVLGVLGCGYLLIPTFGLRMSMLILSGICIAAGLAVLGMTQSRLDPTGSVNTHSNRWVRTAAIFLMIGWGWVSYLMINEPAPIGVSTDNGRWAVDFYHEGRVNTVAVARDNQDANIRKMIIDGISIGASDGDVDEKQQMLAHLPMLLQPEIVEQNVLTIGLGTGILAGELAENPMVGHITCVELSPSVMQAAEYFSDLNGDLFSNEKVTFVLADGIQYLLRNPIRFDAIVSDAKSRPGHAANVSFFSREYYSLCDSRLTQNGIFVQWVSLASSTASLGTIMRTFADAFPFGHIAIAPPGSIYLVGSKRPLTYSESHIAQYFKQESSRSLTRYYWNTFDDFVSMVWLDQTTFGPFVQHDFKINTLDVPVMESFSLDSSRDGPEVIEKQNLAWLLSIIEYDRARTVEHDRTDNLKRPADADAGLANKLRNGKLAAQEMIAAEIRILESNDDWLDQSARHYKSALELLPNLTRQRRIAALYRQLAENASHANMVEQEFSALASINELKASSASDEFRLGRILIEYGKPELALDYLHRATKWDLNNADFRAEFGFCLLDLGKNAQAAQQFRAVIAQQSNHALAHLGLGIVLEKIGEAAEASRHLTKALEQEPALRQRLNHFQRTIDAAE